VNLTNLRNALALAEELRESVGELRAEGFAKRSLEDAQRSAHLVARDLAAVLHIEEEEKLHAMRQEVAA
jgi:hypothetical protein